MSEATDDPEIAQLEREAERHERQAFEARERIEAIHENRAKADELNARTRRLQHFLARKRAANRRMETQIGAERGPQSIYCTDDYPREGCSLAVDVTAEGYTFAVFTPAGQQIEQYRCRTALGLGRMIGDWAAGHAPRPAPWADRP